MTKYFAKLGLNNKVVGISTVADDVATTEQAGIDFLINSNNKYPFWVQCSKDGSIRKNGAIIGATYDEDEDAFIGIQPYKSWTLDENYKWQPPTPVPADAGVDGKRYDWNEETTSWDEIA